MIWFDVLEGTFVMLTVRALAPGRFALLRVGKRGAVVLDSFSCAEEAIRRWNELEQTIRQRSRQRGIGCRGVLSTVSQG